MQNTSNNLVFKIARLWTSPEGTLEKIHLIASPDFSSVEIDARSKLEGELLFAKLKEEIAVMVPQAVLKVRFTCTKCLKQFDDDVTVSNAERRFLAKKPKKFEDLNDTFLINMKDLTIDLHEMLRQEIILHFPLIPVCSTGCKGLCAVCGKDRNQRPCSCKQEETLKLKPFKDLKKLLQ